VNTSEKASLSQIYVATCRQFAEEEVERVRRYLMAGGAPEEIITYVGRLVNAAIYNECEENFRNHDVEAMNQHEHRMYPRKGANHLFLKGRAIGSNYSSLQTLEEWEEAL
jgi:hypothetical protein